ADQRHGLVHEAGDLGSLEPGDAELGHGRLLGAATLELAVEAGALAHVLDGHEPRLRAAELDHPRADLDVDQAPVLPAVPPSPGRLEARMRAVHVVHERRDLPPPPDGVSRAGAEAL